MAQSYGAISRPERIRARAHTSASLRLVALLAISAAVLITLLALVRGPTPQTSRRWLLQTKLELAPAYPPSGGSAAPAHPSDGSIIASSSGMDESGVEPSAADVASFKAQAHHVLQSHSQEKISDMV